MWSGDQIAEVYENTSAKDQDHHMAGVQQNYTAWMPDGYNW